MKINLLFGKGFRAPAGDGSDNGGGVADLLPKSQRLPDADNDESDDGGVTSSDADFYRAYHKLDREGGERGSEIYKFVKKEEKEKEDASNNEENSEDDGKETKDDKKEIKEEETQLTEEEELKQLLETKTEDIRTSAGKPISKESGKFIDKLKKGLAAANEKLANQTVDPQLTEKLTALEKENAELKRQFEEELFEKSPAFETAFIKPVENKVKEITSFFEDIDPVEDKDTWLKVNEAYASAIKLIDPNSPVKFIRAAEKIAEDFVDGGKAVKGMFVDKMKELYQLKVDQQNAVTDKSEKRKKILQEKLSAQRDSNLSGITKSIETHVRGFEINKKAVIDALDENSRKEYQGLYSERVGKTKEAVADFAITGQINPDLEAVIQDGIIAPALKHEVKLAWIAFKDTNNRVAILEQEKAELEKKLAKLSGEPDAKTKSRHVTPFKNKTETKSKYQSVIMQNLMASTE